MPITTETNNYVDFKFSNYRLLYRDQTTWLKPFSDNALTITKIKVIIVTS